MKEKKIGIISIHYGVNFGSSLQAIALSNYIEKMNISNKVEIINYIPKRFRIKSRFFSCNNNNLKDIIRNLIRIGRFEKVNRKYIKFLRNNTNISKPIYSITKASENYKNYDYIITGSDQVWNSEYNQGIDEMYYLGFTLENTKRIAYAASCGIDEYSADEWNEINPLLKKFSAISLREKSSVQMMSNHGIYGCKFVLDPTFLFGISQWSSFETKVENCPKKYLLIYFLDTVGQDIIDISNKIAKKKGLKTVLIRPIRSRIKYNVDMIVHDKTPDYYIWLFRNASFVVTNSFHGVSFSINMERQFVALKREKYNARLDSILSAMGLTNRYITSSFDGNIDEEIDYQKVNILKNKLLDESKAFLREALDIC